MVNGVYVFLSMAQINPISQSGGEKSFLSDRTMSANSRVSEQLVIKNRTACLPNGMRFSPESLPAFACVLTMQAEGRRQPIITTYSLNKF